MMGKTLRKFLQKNAKKVSKQPSLDSQSHIFAEDMIKAIVRPDVNKVEQMLTSRHMPIFPLSRVKMDRMN
jgi:hypothetical protein